jgi:hypothetical protein
VHTPGAVGAAAPSVNGSDPLRELGVFTGTRRRPVNGSCHIFGVRPSTSANTGENDVEESLLLADPVLREEKLRPIVIGIERRLAEPLDVAGVYGVHELPDAVEAEQMIEPGVDQRSLRSDEDVLLWM